MQKHPHSTRVSPDCDIMISEITADHVTLPQYSQLSIRMKPYSDFTQRFCSTWVLFNRFPPNRFDSYNNCQLSKRILYVVRSNRS